MAAPELLASIVASTLTASRDIIASKFPAFLFKVRGTGVVEGAEGAFAPFTPRSGRCCSRTSQRTGDGAGPACKPSNVAFLSTGRHMHSE
jgi:hypothetical protein